MRDTLSNAQWDRAAAANWERLAEDEREVWRDLVRERLPELVRPGRAGSKTWLEKLAIGWAYDPSMVAGRPPEFPPDDPRCTARRLFASMATAAATDPKAEDAHRELVLIGSV